MNIYTRLNVDGLIFIFSDVDIIWPGLRMRSNCRIMNEKRTHACAHMRTHIINHHILIYHYIKKKRI